MSTPPASKRPVCSQHGLTVGPDDRCVLCKRSSARVVEVAPPPAPLASRIVTALFGLAALLGSGALWFIASAAEERHAAPQPSAASEPPRGPAASTADAHAEPARRDAERARENQRLLEQQQRLQQQELSQQSRSPQSAQPPQPQPQPAQTESPAEVAARAARDRARKQQIEADMRARDLARARGNVRIVMYETSWCGVCKRARAYMDAQRIAYVAHDIDRNESARAAMKRLNPRGGVPTIDIEGEILVGFGPAALEAAITQAAAKRAGI